MKKYSARSRFPPRIGADNVNLLLFVLGALAVYLLQALLCRLFWRYKLLADAFFSDQNVTEGDEVLLTAIVENHKLIPVPTIKINMAVERGLVFQDQSNLAVSDKNYRSEIFALHSRERVTRELPLFCAKRGYYSITGMDLVGNDLFYTMYFRSRQPLNCTLCVYPGRADSRQLMVAAQRMLGDCTIRSADCDDPFTFRGIRPYESFDAMKDINWKATAKTGELRVNVHEYTAEQEIYIVLDTEWDMLLRPDALLEESIRIASSIADEFIGAGITTALATNGKDCLTGDFFRLAGGADRRHADAIRRGLARIKLTEQGGEETLPTLLSSLTDEIAARPNRQVSWVLISTEANTGVAAAWDALRVHAANAYWIVPAHERADLSDELLRREDIFYWEVPRGK